MATEPVLYIFGGLPGTGKTTLSRQLAREVGAVHVRIDTIEQALRECIGTLSGPEGYVAAYGVASDNLRLGWSVIADSVNPLRITREAWRSVADGCGVPYVEIEIVCSAISEHRQRVELRRAGAPAVLQWSDVARREYEPWDRPHIVLDTAGQTVTDSYSLLERLLKLPSRL